MEREGQDAMDGMQNNDGMRWTGANNDGIQKTGCKGWDAKDGM